MYGLVGNWRLLSATYHACPCVRCGRSIPRGTPAYYWPKPRAFECTDCHEAQKALSEATVEDRPGQVSKLADNP